MTASTVSPFDRGEIDHGNADEDKKHSCRDRQGLAEKGCVLKHRFDQKFRVPSPLRPQTTMAMEKLNMAAKDAQPRVNNMRLTT